MGDIIKKIDSAPVKISSSVNLGLMRERKRSILPSQVVLKSLSPAGQTSLQVLFMFDITVSMFGHFELIRKKIIEIAEEVSRDSPNAQFAVFAFRNHGDEDLHGRIYYTSPLTSDIRVILETINGIKRGGGGKDSLTCMEDCLQEANKLLWASDCAKMIVIIGDMPPHGVMDEVDKCPRGIDYRHEIKRLRSTGAKIYSVFCGQHEEAESFYRQTAEETGGNFMELSEIDQMVKILTGLCLKETGNLAKYVDRLKKSRQLSAKDEKLLLSLR